MGRGVGDRRGRPAGGGPELAAVASDARVSDFGRSFYGGEAGRRAFEEQGLRRVGMRSLRDLVRMAG